jgi:hypothetical protein
VEKKIDQVFVSLVIDIYDIFLTKAHIWQNIHLRNHTLAKEAKKIVNKW